MLLTEVCTDTNNQGSKKWQHSEHKRNSGHCHENYLAKGIGRDATRLHLKFPELFCVAQLRSSLTPRHFPVTE